MIVGRVEQAAFARLDGREAGVITGGIADHARTCRSLNPGKRHRLTQMGETICVKSRNFDITKVAIACYPTTVWGDHAGVCAHC